MRPGQVGEPLLGRPAPGAERRATGSRQRSGDTTVEDQRLEANLTVPVTGDVQKLGEEGWAQAADARGPSPAE